MMAPESDVLEYKQDLTKTFLKTVSAFGNFHDGDIIFGVADDLTVPGLDHPAQFAESVAHMINDSFTPAPPYDVSVNEDNRTVVLHVYKGMHRPYLYKGKAYERRGSSTVETDRAVLQDLILESRNMTWDELPSSRENLTFAALEREAQNAFGLEKLGNDALRSLGLLSGSRFNHAAELLSDQNDFPGIDLTVFGDSVSIIRLRKIISGCSLIDQYWQALELFKSQYVYETIEESLRKKTERIPETAFREALVNALIHRNWNLPGFVSVQMYPDHIQITSPGGLPITITEEEYLNDNVSDPRNQTLAWIFLRLHLIERLGTGIARIKEAYAGSEPKPQFHLGPHRIRIELPVTDIFQPLTSKQSQYLDKMTPGVLYTRQDLEALFSLSRQQTLSILNTLLKSGYLTRMGSGRAVRYLRRPGQ